MEIELFRAVFMSTTIPRVLTGLGQEIFDKIHKPLLSSSNNFDRVSSFLAQRD